ncbi:MAG: N-acetyltransferase [Lacunisphaera sp.]|nr:N-acetyltransferase [Lacunisphaera sp.]
MLGVIGHNRIDWAQRIGFPAYWIAPDSQGKGIMTQCCRVVIEHAFADLQLNASSWPLPPAISARKRFLSGWASPR